jgi:alpha-1,2-mannosyltransferase
MMVETTTVTRRTVAQVLVVLALAGAAWWFLAAFAVRHGSFDLKVYYGAVNYWLHGGGEVYDYLKPFTKYGFTYPPFAALAMSPMAILPWWAVNALTITASVAATLVMLDWFLRPVASRYGWTRWFTVAVAACFAAIFEPLHETVSFGQVNLLLLILVLADFRLLIGRGSRFGGALIGLAAAVKLTPGIFALYLLVTRRYRAGVTAIATAAGATVLAMLVAPDASREFWTDALWDTDRVGTLSFISNQSLEGFVARLNPTHPSTALWLVLVLVALAGWAWRARRAVRAGDELAGVALTGIAGCLISPVTWVHHLVWLLPALLLLFDRSLSSRGWRRWTRLALCVGLFALLCSRLVWGYAGHYTGIGLLLSNAYVAASLILFVALPIRPVPVGAAGSGQAAGVPELGQVDEGAVRAPDGVARMGTVGREPGPLVEPPRLDVVHEHP